MSIKKVVTEDSVVDEVVCLGRYPVLGLLLVPAALHLVESASFSPRVHLFNIQSITLDSSENTSNGRHQTAPKTGP